MLLNQNLTHLRKYLSLLDLKPMKLVLWLAGTRSAMAAQLTEDWAMRRDIFHWFSLWINRLIYKTKKMDENFPHKFAEYPSLCNRRQGGVQVC